MPAPATSSRHLYTGHRRGHIQAAPRLRAHRGEPLSRDHPQIPVSMPSLFRFDASAVVHTCSSSHRTPAPLTARRQPQRSPPRLLTDAACGGLESPPARRPRRTYLHHWHSTDRADDLLHHHHHFPSGHTWVPIIRSWALTRGFALHPGTRNRYKIRYTRTQDRPASLQVNAHDRVFGTHTRQRALERGMVLQEAAVAVVAHHPAPRPHQQGAPSRHLQVADLLGAAVMHPAALEPALRTAQPQQRRLDAHHKRARGVLDHLQHTDLRQVQPHPHNIASQRGPPGS